MKNASFSASLMCADLLRMENSLDLLKEANADLLHIDIMDGHFVPNITLGFDFVNAVKEQTDIPLDVHMMVSQPSAWLDRMQLTREDYICVHYESDCHVHRTLEQIKKKGCKAGLALNPATPLACVENVIDCLDMLLIMTVDPGFAGQKMFAQAAKKVSKARSLLTELGYGHIPIEVDGNINLTNARLLRDCGADIFVLGTSALFLKDKSLAEAARDFRDATRRNADV